jgi:uncharacterized protein
MDEKTQTELEAAAFRRLIGHLRQRSEVQNIDLMNLAGFCRNCYGMAYEEWKALNQKEATPAQQASFEKSHKH